MRTVSDVSDAVADGFTIDATTPEEVETATFGMGCFWSSEARFGALDGVVRTRVGYAGGDAVPEADDIADHTEVVQIEYDPDRMDYGDALEVFWAGHDPTEDQGRKYRSLILAHDERQRERAEAHLAGIERQTDVTVATDVESYDTLYLAPDDHQKYYLRGEEELMAEFESYSPAQLINSTAAARVNAVMGGHGSERTLETVREPFDAPPQPESDLESDLEM